MNHLLIHAVFGLTGTILPNSSGRFRGGGPGGPGPPLLKIPKMKKRVPPVENPKNAKGGTPFEKIINEKGPH